MRRMLTMTAATTAALLLSVQPATAGGDRPATFATAASWDNWMYTDDAGSGGRVQFRAYGDVMRLCDVEADGRAVALDVTDQTTGHTYSRRIGGEGRCLELRASLGAPYDLAEKHLILVQIILTKVGEPGTGRDSAVWWNG